jgi:hypothetical protein
MFLQPGIWRSNQQNATRIETRMYGRE